MLSFKVSDGLFLTQECIAKTESLEKPIERPVNHIVLIDCSGSMYSELPKIREQLKKKLPKLIGEKDTLSVIWFSGKKEFGTLLEAEPVATLADLAEVNRAIDRWLRPVGLTGFKEPLEEASKVIERIKKKNDNVFSLFFMSDGCDNQWDRSEILRVVEKTAGGLSSATFVEYGYYADRPLLTEMAEKAGGQLIFAEHFDRFQPIFEGVLAKKLSGAPRIEVKIPVSAIGGFVYTLIDGDLTTYSVDNGKALVPEDTAEIWWLSPIGERPFEDACSLVRDFANGGKETRIIPPLYAAVSLYSVRMKPDVVYPLLKCLGDVHFIEQFSTCFGKQRYSEYMDSVKAAAFEVKCRFTKGFDQNKVPADDAYTILDLLQLLSSETTNTILLEHPEFKYTRIGRSRVDANEVVTEEEQAKIAEITEKMTSEKNATKLKDLQKELAALMDSKPEALKFKSDPCPHGYPISSLTYNEDRPNISMLVRKSGTVDLSSRLPDNLKDKLPCVFPTFVFRNYAVLKDGLVNIEKLPVRVTKATANKLAALLPKEAKPNRMTISGDFVEGVINLSALPVINRRMVKSASAKVLFQQSFELETARAAQKVYRFYRDEKVPRKESASFKSTYGNEAAEWLASQGFTDYSGFCPKTIQDEATDCYMSKELCVSIKGFSSLPKVADVRAKLGSSKMTPSVALMAPFVREVEAWLNGPEYTKAVDPEASFIAWIDGKAQDAIAKARQLIYEIACIKFSIVVGQVWFSEFSSLDENTMTLDFGNLTGINCKVQMKEVQVKL